MSTARFLAALITSGGSASGSVSVTDSSDVVAITGLTPGVVAITDAGDVVSVTGVAPAVGTVAVTDAGDSASVTGTGGSTNNIRLQPSFNLERGGYAASLSGLRWWVLDSSLAQVENSGTGATTNSTGQLTIDITASVSWEVGDYVPLIVASYDSGTSAPDRTVLSGLVFALAIAQP